ncbi:MULTISPECIES: hypothetical protein [Bacillus]|uniref:Uncharacterized protein n=2 Tax=Bacillus thuringiensis TaxID=1428 RepID=A0AAP4Q807_BACTU|nr:MULTISPECIES: hypothetical protein [Bacillus]AFV21652.1 hypothetical protein BTB_502p03470 [Bacillus thuringiensis Bt407]ERI01172.1 hypothetical protein BTCBT_002727 [Bacillus thuringiensis T01-328]MBN6707925.1 hypothetical protein [Bacillus thuringiensis]MDF9599140.1 hypothetical protein [Bacillus cereus]MDG1589473.1 hypothetical protein [Bacillus cereus]
MKNVEGIEYTISGFENPDKLAVGIMKLTAEMYSAPGIIWDIQTDENTNPITVKVISANKIDDKIESLIGEIIDIKVITKNEAFRNQL